MAGGGRPRCRRRQNRPPERPARNQSRDRSAHAHRAVRRERHRRRLWTLHRSRTTATVPHRKTRASSAGDSTCHPPSGRPRLTPGAFRPLEPNSKCAATARRISGLSRAPAESRRGRGQRALSDERQRSMSDSNEPEAAKTLPRNPPIRAEDHENIVAPYLQAQG